MRKRVTFEYLHEGLAWVSVVAVVDYLIQDGNTLTLVDVMDKGTVRSQFYGPTRNLIVQSLSEPARPLTKTQFKQHIGEKDVA